MFFSRKFLSCAKISVTLVAFCLVGSFAAVAKTVTDDLNRQVEVADTVTRTVVADIYPLAGSLALFLGGPEKIVGIHPVSMQAVKGRLLAQLWPSMTNIDTTFMKGSEINVESLLALKPDVVFVNANNRNLIRRLESLGIAALAVSTNKNNYDVLATFDSWMKILQSVWPDKTIAQQAKTQTQAIVRLVKDRTASLRNPKRIFFLVNYDARRIVTSGQRFFGQYWADMINAVNVAQAITAESANAQVNMEQVYAFDPEVIFITNFTKATPQTLYDNTFNDWSSVQAVRDKAVYKMPLGIYRSYTPAADSPLTLLWLAKTTYPELFADIDLVARAKDFYQKVFGIALTDTQAQSLYGYATK